MSALRRWLIVLALVGLVGVALWVTLPQSRAALEPFLRAETWRASRQWIRGFGVLAPLVSIGVSVAQILPIPIPPPTIPLANGWLFGPLVGTLVTWLGVMLNGVLGYYLAKGPGRRLFVRLLGPTQLARAESAVQRHGAMAVLIGRMIPVIPFSAISIAAGLVHLRWRSYMVANALGLLPSSFALALIGYQLSRGRLDWGQVGIAIAIMAGLSLLGIPLARWFNGR